jgi:hypothetical protein
MGPLNGEGLGDAATEAMSDQHGSLNAEVVEQGENGGRVCTAGGTGGGWRVAASVAGQVDNDETMARGEVAGDGVPEPRRGWKAVQEDHRISGASCPCGVVIEPHSPDIHELAAHQVNLVLSRKNGILISRLLSM